MLKLFKDSVADDGPRAADGEAPRARHPVLWFVALYGAGVLAVTAVAAVLHVMVFAAAP